VSSPATTAPTGPSSPSSDFEFIKRHPVIAYPEFWVELDEYRAGSDQLVIAHIRFAKFSPSILKRVDHVWRCLRASLPCPLYAYGEEDNDKWERFVKRLGFQPLCEVHCLDGAARRLFISIPNG
jgi:hypothetical protein